MRRIRILLADDHTMICAGFRRLLEPEFEAVGTVGDGRSLLTAAEQLKPDLVLVDIGEEVSHLRDAD
jgi:DNA-binding NarL/FixJ family response regulator